METLLAAVYNLIARREYGAERTPGRLLAGRQGLSFHRVFYKHFGAVSLLTLGVKMVLSGRHSGKFLGVCLL